MFDIQRLARQPSLAEAPTCDARLIVTARLWVTLRKRGFDPDIMTAQRLGTAEAACRFWLLMEEVGAAWPEPFMVSPPCCGRMSTDEATLLTMIVQAGRNQRIEFIATLREMIPIESADRLYAATRSLLDAMPRPIRVARA